MMRVTFVTGGQDPSSMVAELSNPSRSDEVHPSCTSQPALLARQKSCTIALATSLRSTGGSGWLLGALGSRWVCGRNRNRISTSSFFCAHCESTCAVVSSSARKRPSLLAASAYSVWRAFVLEKLNHPIWTVYSASAVKRAVDVALTMAVSFVGIWSAANAQSLPNDVEIIRLAASHAASA